MLYSEYTSNAIGPPAINGILNHRNGSRILLALGPVAVIRPDLIPQIALSMLQMYFKRHACRFGCVLSATSPAATSSREIDHPASSGTAYDNRMLGSGSVTQCNVDLCYKNMCFCGITPWHTFLSCEFAIQSSLNRYTVGILLSIDSSILTAICSISITELYFC